MEPTQEDFAAAEAAANPAAQAPLSSWLLVSAGQGHGAQAVLPAWAAAAAANHPLASAAGYSTTGLPGVIDLQQAATLLSHQQHQAAAVLAARQQQEQIAAHILAQNQDVQIATLLARHQQQAQEAAIAEAYQQRQRLVDAAKFLEHDRRVAEARVPGVRSREHTREESDVAAAVRRSEEEAFLAERDVEEHRYRQDLRSGSLHSSRSLPRRASSSSSSTSAEIVEVRKSSDGKRKLQYDQKYELERAERYKHDAEVSRKKSRYYESVETPERKHGRTLSLPQSASPTTTASHHRHPAVAPASSYARPANLNQVEELIDILTNEKEFDSKSFKPTITLTHNQVKDICIRVQTTYSKLLSAKATPPKSQRKERELKTVVDFQKREISGLKKTLQMMKARRESEKNTYKEHLRQSHLSSEEALRAYMRSSVHALQAVKRGLKSKKTESRALSPSES